MKFAYVDESGGKDQGDIFVMAGLLIDAYRLRKHTAKFDGLIAGFLAKHPGAPKELKTKAFINGSDGWSKVDHTERKQFLGEVCDLAAECMTVFAIVLSFEKFAAKAADGPLFGKSHWLGAATFIAALVQREMQRKRGSKGLTVLICDDNKREMANLSDVLFEADPWFDPIYQITEKKKGKTVWKKIPDGERFDQIVNCAFAIKSQHSSLVQVADAVCYVYRRHLELKSEAEKWDGEIAYFAALVSKLEPERARLGRNPGGPCIEFYEATRHPEWDI